MGKPGGFFKKLKAKQKKAASRQRRGTKGATKEDRRQKRNEQVEYYAAKREAEDLAAVSSSSEEEDSTDSEAETAAEERSLRKLRAMLGVNGGTQKYPKSMHHGKPAKSAKNRGSDGDSEIFSQEEGSDGEEGEESFDGEDRGSMSGHSAAREEEEEEDVDGEDWKLYVGDDEEDENEEEDAIESDDNEGLFGEDGLLIEESDDEEEEEEEDNDEEEANDNPLFGLDEDGDAGSDDLGGLREGDYEIIDDDEEMEDDEEEDEGSVEEGEEDREADYVDEDESDSDVSLDDAKASGKKKAKSSKSKKDAKESEEAAKLLQSFSLGRGAVSAIETIAPCIRAKDEWVRKYHLDLHGAVDASPLQPMEVPAAAVTALTTSNAPLRARAAHIAEVTTVKRELGMFYVSVEEYDKLHPENVAVKGTASAAKHLLHAPFLLSKEAANTAAKDEPSAKKARREEDHSLGSPLESCPIYLHPALWAKWTAFRAEANKPIFTYEERGLLDLLQGYADVLDSMLCWQNSESRREIYVLHLLNHWFKARSVVMAHDAMLAERRRRYLAKRQGAKKDADKKKSKNKTGAKHEARKEEAEEEEDEELELRDRGFGKTRLFIMCPLRNHAYKLVHTIVTMLRADPNKCPKLGMFQQDFTEVEEAMDPNFKHRPRDYQRAFEGNIDDAFCVGLKLESDRVHLYAHPLNSDLIICSPLGLRRRVEKNGDVLVSLSSVEVCYIPDAQMLFQQNWMHVTAVLEMINKRPTDTTHGLSDLRRVYGWALEGKSGRHRQTLFSTEVYNAVMLSSFRTTSVNNSGKLLVQRKEEEGALSKVVVPVRQHFIRFHPSGLDTVDDDRFDYFTTQLYANKINALAERDVRVIIVAPSYFDFVRLRNYLYREYRESFAALSEYTSLKQQRQVLGQFSDLERPVLLMTERFYYFKRYFVKMAEILIFYSPPMFPDFYAALANKLVATSPNAFIMTLFCQYDTHELNRLVGSKRLVPLLKRESDVFSFVTS